MEILTDTKLCQELVALRIYHLNLGCFYIFRSLANNMAHTAKFNLSGGTTLRFFGSSSFSISIMTYSLRFEQMIYDWCISRFVLFIVFEEFLWLIFTREKILAGLITAIIVKSSWKIKISCNMWLFLQFYLC